MIMLLVLMAHFSQYNFTDTCNVKWMYLQTLQKKLHLSKLFKSWIRTRTQRDKDLVNEMELCVTTCVPAFMWLCAECTV